MNGHDCLSTCRKMVLCVVGGLLFQIAPAEIRSQQSPTGASDSADTQAEGRIYSVGGEVTAPVPLYKPEPEYSEEARRAKYQGTVVLWILVGASGHVERAGIVRPLGLGLDAKALEAVRTWKFKPALRRGVPVPVRAIVEVSFRLGGAPCRLRFAFAETSGAETDQLSWGKFPQDALNWWSQKGGSEDFPLICSVELRWASYAILAKGSSRPGAMRTEVYQLSAGKIQFPALFVSKENTSAKRALKDAVKYLDREVSKGQ